MSESQSLPLDGVAIIGMDGRFPGAANLDSYWKNLRDGIESVTFFTAEELEAAGIDAARRGAANFVAASGVLEDIDAFDARFFDYTPHEAERLDPQQRLFLESAWTAFENSGYCPGSFAGEVGVFAGSGINGYLLNNLAAGGNGSAVDDLTTLLGSDKDFLSTRVSYHLDLTGPSVVVQSGCSTSLLAVAQACQALLGHQCDMALAGGVAVRVPKVQGYTFVPESTMSPDGHCRAFDARAQGTSFGSGLGVVVLKRVADAIADGDTIHAVIRGSAVNNDGARKQSYTAPSVDRQAAVIAMAQAQADVDPQTVSYVEAHGTGTALGDPVEVEALTQAFRTSSEKKGYCALGSVKTNLGHLDAASGISGLIKTVLALKHRQIPPSLNYSTPNPALDFANSPFFVNTELREWKTDGTPLRAGVSSFGIGGTNVHLVLEEAPTIERNAAALPRQLIMLSAKTPTALESTTANLRAFIEENPDADLADLAYTLQVGRKGFEHRRVFVCEDKAEACEKLDAPDSKSVVTGVAPSSNRSPIFLFPDEDSVHVNMGRDLYNDEPIFREHVDVCCESLREHLGLDLRHVLYPTGENAVDGADLEASRLAQPAAFVIEYALARLWMEWGLRPSGMLGVGVGEWVAACLTQVFRLEHALELVALRGLWADVSSTAEEEAARKTFIEAFERKPRKPPELAFISGVTGQNIAPTDAISSDYWVRQQSSETRLADGFATLMSGSDRIWLEVGSETSLTDLAKEHSSDVIAIQSMRHADGCRSDTAVILAAVGQLWMQNVSIDWRAFAGKQDRRRIPLPTYPFERTRHWIEPANNGGSVEASIRSSDPKDWFYIPAWKRARALTSTHSASGASPERWLIFVDEGETWSDLVRELKARATDLVVVRASTRYAQLTSSLFELNPASQPDYDALFEALNRTGLPTDVAHFWLANDRKESSQETLARGFFSLNYLTEAFAKLRAESELQISVVTSETLEVVGDALRPVKATVLGACRVLPQEHPGIQIRAIDVGNLAESGPSASLMEQLGRELVQPITQTVVALRGGYRWLPDYESVELASAPTKGAAGTGLRSEGVYVITGGLGGIGLTLAEFLARECSAKLVLVGRSEAWPAVRARIEELEKLGAEVLVERADVADRVAMERVFRTAREKFGAVNGVIHAAGVAGAGLLGESGASVASDAFAAKLDGTEIILELCGDEPDFLLLTSAMATVLGGLGQADYCAANDFMDAVALQRRGGTGMRVLSIGWDTWAEVGMAKEASVPDALRDRHAEILADGLTCDEGVEVFRRVLAANHAHLLVSTTPIVPRLEAIDGPRQTTEPVAEAREVAPISTPGPAVTPRAEQERDEIEVTVAQAWTQLLGIDHADSFDSFFEAGGNSLLATQMLARLRADYPNAELSLRALFDDPTIAGTSEIIRKTYGVPTAEPTTEENQLTIRERLFEAGANQTELLDRYLREQVAEAVGATADSLPEDGGLESFDGTLLAAHLSWVVRRDFELAIFPAEIRQHTSIGSLGALILTELNRLSGPVERQDDERQVSTTSESASSPAASSSQAISGSKNESMAFVLSAPRSGSTLLRLMLSAHSKLFCPPELFLLDSENMRSWSDDPFNDLFRDGLVRAFMALHGIDYERGGALVDELVAAETPIGDVYRQLQSGDGRLLVDKTPTYALNLSSLHRAEELFEQPRYIALVRHPHSVIESIVRNRLDRVRKMNGDAHTTAETYWVKTYRNVLTFRDRVGERLKLVSYEDLLREPESALRGLCEFLGVEFEPSVLDPYQHGKMFSGPGDPGLFERGAIDPKLADVWKTIRLPRPLGDDASALAAEFGYELPR